jgi:hypothetical protein
MLAMLGPQAGLRVAARGSGPPSPRPARPASGTGTRQTLADGTSLRPPGSEGKSQRNAHQLEKDRFVTDLPQLPPRPGDPEAERQKLIDNERVKLLALALNNAAVAALATGVLGPTASFLYGVTRIESPYSFAFGLFWIAGAVSMHAVAQIVLKDLVP